MALLDRPVRRLLLARRKVPSHPVHQLADDALIAAGTQRKCYRHPADARLCIMVPRDPDNRAMQGANLVEWFMLGMLDWRGISTQHRITSRGWAATEQGPGLVLERVTNEDGRPALRLDDFIRQKQPSREQLEAMYEELKQWLFANKVPVNDLFCSNLLVRQTQTGAHLVLVDGLCGERFRFKLLVYGILPDFTFWRARRRWLVVEDKFRRDMEQYLPAQSKQSDDVMSSDPLATE